MITNTVAGTHSCSNFASKPQEEAAGRLIGCPKQAIAPGQGLQRIVDPSGSRIVVAPCSTCTRRELAETGSSRYLRDTSKKQKTALALAPTRFLRPSGART